MTKTTTTATFSAETFSEAMRLMDYIQMNARPTAKEYAEIQSRLFEVIRLASESAGSITIEEVDEEKDGDPFGHCAASRRERMAKWITDDLPQGDYDTVLGWLSKNAPRTLASCDDPVEETQRDGFWLVNQCHRRGHAIYKVPSPIGVYDYAPAIHEVNAYPSSLIEERFRNTGVI